MINKRRGLIQTGLTALSLAIAFILLSVMPAAAALTVEPITWNVIGLDSNDPSTGPNQFPVGVRITNNNAFAVTSVQATFEWDLGGGKFVSSPGADPYINLRDGSNDVLTFASLAAGASVDAYFSVQVTRSALAYNNTRRYHVQVTATGDAGPYRSPQPRELFIEYLVSQSRNSDLNVEVWQGAAPPTSVPKGSQVGLMVGQTYNIRLTSSTATQGYGQLETFLDLPNVVFRVNSVVSTYSANTSPDIPDPAPPGPPIAGQVDKLYGDACRWVNNPSDVNYRSCQVDGKAGGSITATYNVTIMAVPPGAIGNPANITAMIYDFSGSSYHYNADYGISTRFFYIYDNSSVTIQKSFTPKTIAPNGTSTMTITLTNPTTSTFTNVNFSDAFPAGVSVKNPPTVVISGSLGAGARLSSTASPTYTALAGGETTVYFFGGTLGPNSSGTITVDVTSAAAASYLNTTGILYINGTTSTGNTANDTLTVSSAPVPSAGCASPATMVTWNMPTTDCAVPPCAGPPPYTPPIHGDLTSAAASQGGAGTFSIVGVGNPLNSWQASFNNVTTHTFPNPAPAAATIGTTSPYFDIQVDYPTNKFNGIYITFDARLTPNGSWGPNANNAVYIYSRNDTGPWDAGVAIQTDKGVWLSRTYSPFVTYGTSSGSTRTTFRISGAGSSVGGLMQLDNIVVRGCVLPNPPTLSKAFLPAGTAALGTTKTLRFTITNPNAGSALSGITFTDILPTGLIPGAPTATAGGWTTAPSISIVGQTVTIGGATAGVLPASGTGTVDVTVTGAAAGTYQNTSTNIRATESGTNFGGANVGYGSASLTVVAPPTITKVFGSSPIFTGNTSRITFTITNPNAATALSGISFSDILPTAGNGDIVVATPPNASVSASLAPGFVSEDVCGSPANPFEGGETTIYFCNGSLAAGASGTVSIDVRGVNPNLPGSPYSNTTTAITSTEGGTGATANDTIVVRNLTPGINILKQVSISPIGPWLSYATVPANGTVYYQFTVENTGDVPLSPVSVTDPLVSTATCTWTDPLPVAVAANENHITTCVVSAAAIPGGQLNTATASGTYGGTPYTKADSATYATLSVNKATTTPHVGRDGIVVYTIVAQNSGTDSLANFQVTDAVPYAAGQYTVLGVSGSVTSGTITFNPGYDGSGDINLLAAGNTLAASATATIFIRLQLINATVATYSNSATAFTTRTGSVVFDGTPVTETGDDVTVSAATINAVNDDFSATPIYGVPGGTTATVFTGDTLNGNPVDASNVTVTIPAGGDGGIGATINPDGTINIPPNTPAGTYTVVYEICEGVPPVFPANCDTAAVTIVVLGPNIDAVDDDFSANALSAASGGTTATVYTNDTLNGIGPVSSANVTPSIVNAGGLAGLSINANGTLTIAAANGVGTYTVRYRICSIALPVVCDEADVLIEIKTIDAVNDNYTASPFNGFVGGTTATSVFNNDTLNGVGPVTSANVDVSISDDGGLTGVSINANGFITVPAGTPAGTYSVTYQVCEKPPNDANCDTATALIQVDPPIIDAVDNDFTGSPVNGYTGGTTASVYGNDTLNGAAFANSAVTSSITNTGGLTGVSINANGTLTIPPGTPSGNYAVTYRICEVLNPTNCDTATVQVQITAPVIIANDDDFSATALSSLTGGTTSTVYANDTLNGAAFLPAAVTPSITASTLPLGDLAINPDGTITVTGSHAAGTYTVTYEICDVINPANCDTATVTLTLKTIDAVNDDFSGTPVDGVTGGTTATVFGNDSLNGGGVDSTNVTVTIPPGGDGGIGATIDADGIITIPPGTAAGTYTITYQICEEPPPIPANCDTATVTVVVSVLSTIQAVDDNGVAVYGVTGGQSLGNVLNNDILNGSGASLANVDLFFVSSTDPGVTLNVLDGSVNVTAGTAAGTYTLTYRICESAVPANCDTADVTVVVTGSPVLIDAVDDAFTVNNSLTGGVTASVFDNDTLNGGLFLPGDVTLTPVTVPAGFVLNADGTIYVPPGLAPGPYTVTYEICDVLNPLICDTATVTITVLAAPINAITGTVFNDLNGDGVRDPGEPGISGVTVLLYDNLGTTLLWSTVTAADGTYVFTNLVPGGVYDVVEVDLFGYTSTTLNTINDLTVPAGNTATANFGDQQKEKLPRQAIRFENPLCSACNATCPAGDFYCSVADSPSLDLTARGSIEAWIQATSCAASDEDAGIFIKGTSAACYGFGLSGGTLFNDGTGTAQNIGFVLGDALGGANDVIVATAKTLTPGKWYHVACVWDDGGNAAADVPGSTMAIYINGVLEATGSSAINVRTNGDELRLGQQTIVPAPNNGQFFGIVEETRVWSTARTKVEIRDNMCKTLSLPAAGLVCYLKYDEASGTTATDASGSGNDGDTSNAFIVCSEAPLGDSSAYDYYDILDTYSVSIAAGTDTVAVSTFTGTWDAASKSGIQIYRVEDAPEPENGPMGSKLFGSRGYWGVYVTGGVDPTYQVTYTYGLGGIGDTANLDLLYRHQGCAPWINLNATPGAGTLTQTGLSGTEFILGTLVDPRNTINFDGTDDVVTVADDNTLDLSTAGTLEAWIYIDNHTANGGIIHKGDNTGSGDEAYALTLGPASNTIVFTVRDAGGADSITSAITLNPDTWYHVAGVWDDAVTDSMQIYINGILDATATPTRTAQNSGGGLNIGQQFTAGAGTYEPFDGYIDEVRVWATALTQAQIRANMCRKLTGAEAGLAGYWRFDEETGSVTCPDYSANTNDGTMTGFTTPVLFPIETARICSSAPIGDASAYDYYDGIPGTVSAQVTHGDGDYLLAVQNTGTWNAQFSGVQVYLLNEAPVYGPDLWTTPDPPYSYQSPNGLTPPTGWSSVDYYRYWGVFTTDWVNAKTYDATYYYNGNPSVPVDDSVVGLARRPDYCFGTWSDSTAVLNTGADTLIKTLETGTEYALGGKDAPLAITLASFTAAVADGCVDVIWETATEINTAGFHVWRSDNPLTGFVRINNGLIASKSVAETMGAKYTFTDCGVDFSNGEKYYYMLEEVEIDSAGSDNMHGPIGPVSENVTAAQSAGGGNDKNCFIDSLSWR